MKKFIETLENLKKWNINLVSLTEDVNTSTPTNMLFVQFIAILAEFEHNSISDRTKEELKAARARVKKNRQCNCPVRKNVLN